MPKILIKVNHLRKDLHCSQPAPFSFGPHPLTAMEKPRVSASSETLQ